ncbi:MULTISPECIES: hypothetical protein [unclassified Streptomyces]|uniref:hypothetical protein n=1 Tax=unclassified Streptomyces TaxID=2593676 RepID=UPI0004C7FEBD|nr:MULTISPECIES: hypothetical protein [unclassified Streptomyces]KOV86099.1 hypothetical protein ADL02_19620 [Streptomyces sp. NRRL WC-3723]
MTAAIQPALDGSVPAPGLDYHRWCDLVRPAFVAAARSGRRFTVYEVADEHQLPEPPNPRADWGNFTQSLVRDRVIEHVAFERSSRPTGERSAVSVWRGTRAAQAGRIA